MVTEFPDTQRNQYRAVWKMKFDCPYGCKSVTKGTSLDGGRPITTPSLYGWVAGTFELDDCLCSGGPVVDNACCLLMTTLADFLPCQAAPFTSLAISVK